MHALGSNHVQNLELSALKAEYSKLLSTREIHSEDEVCRFFDVVVELKRRLDGVGLDATEIAGVTRVELNLLLAPPGSGKRPLTGIHSDPGDVDDIRLKLEGDFGRALGNRDRD